MKRFLFLVLAAIGYFTSAHVAQAQTFTPISPTVPIVAPNGSSSASTAISQAAFGSVIQVYDAASVPITWAVSKTSGEASASSSSTTVAPGATSYFYIGNGISDAAVYGIGGTGTVYIQVGNGGGGGGGGGGLISCSTNQLIYYAATGTTGSCLTLGTNLSITSGTLNATAGGGGVSTFTGDGSLLNNSASTGAVTATLANTGVGYAVWGDISSSSGAPGYHALSSYPAAAFPTLNQSTTGNAATTTALSTTGSNGTFWGVSAGAQGWYTPTAAASSITPGTTTVSGATAPCLIDNSTGTTMGCAALGSSLALSSGTLNTTQPNRTVTTSPTILSTDMGGIIFMNVSGGGTLTVPAIGSGIFGNGQSVWVVNYSASTAAVSTTPTINSGGGCVSATGIPAGDAWSMISNGTSIDCAQSTPTSSGGSGSPGGSTYSIQYNNAGAFGGVSLTAGTVMQGTGTSAAPTATATPLVGVAGTTVGEYCMANATSGSLCIAPPTGALGSAVLTAPDATTTLAGLGVNQQFTNANTFTNTLAETYSPPTSAAAINMTGTIQTSGTSTTNFPYIYAHPGSPTAVTTWSANGTLRGDNMNSGFTGNFLDEHVNGGASVFSMNYQGNVIGGTYNGVTIPSASDTAALLAATQTLTNKSIAASEVNSGTLAAAQMPALTGDCTTTAGAVATTCTKTNGTAFSALATTTPGTGVSTALGNAISTAGGVTETIASGTATLGTSAIASGACATAVTVSATGVATTDVVKAGFNSDPTGVTGYGVSATGAVLTIYPYPTSGNVNFRVCNSTSASITPGAMTLNWDVTR